MSNSQGWISLHRKLLDNPIFSNYKLLQTFIYCLLKASHADREQLVGDDLVTIKTGQLVTGRKAISKATKLSEQNVRTALNRLEKLGILTIKPTNKYSIITVVAWDLHQQTNQQTTSSQPTSNQQVTTNNNYNNVNNSNNKKEKIPYQLVADAYNDFFYSKVNNSSECQTVSPKRKTAISKLWNHKPNQPEGKASTNNIDYWQRYFDYSANQAGLNGGKASKDFDWIADFDALMNFNKYVKNIEGGYA